MTDAALYRTAAAIVDSGPVISTYAACEWDCLSDDGKQWIMAIVKEAAGRHRAALEAIQKAVIDGEVCDDVAWFDKATTLHDFIDDVLNPAPPAAVGDLFDASDSSRAGEG